MSNVDSSHPTPIRAYFSHSYRPQDKHTNLYFWEFFNKYNFRFAVDRKPDPPTPMYIPYIEWLMRQSACFVAVIPRREDSPFFQVSRYQVFESELAGLVKKPRLLFIQKGLPEHLFKGDDDEICYFDPAWYKSDAQKDEFTKKSEILIRKAKAYIPKIGPIRSVGIMLNPGDGYSEEIKNALKQIVKRNGFPSVEYINPSYDFSTAALFSMDIEKYEILIGEIREPYVSADILATIQNRCIPTIRICHLEKEENEADAERDLHLSYELRDESWLKPTEKQWPKILSGYQLDSEMQPVIFWKTQEQLVEKVNAQLAKIQHSVESLDDNIEAKKYFKSFGRRKDKIFISNHNERNDLAKEVYKRLKLEEGIDTFHYTDLDAIETGTPDWLKRIYSHIESSKIFLIILSKQYMESENCVVEIKKAKELYRKHKIELFPYKVDMDMESWPSDTFWRIQGKDLSDPNITNEKRGEIITKQITDYLEKQEKSGYVIPPLEYNFKEFNIVYNASKGKLAKFDGIKDGKLKNITSQEKAQYSFEVLDLVTKLGSASENWATVIDTLSDDLYKQVFKEHENYWKAFMDDFEASGFAGRELRFCIATDQLGFNVPFEWMRTSEKGTPICLEHPVRRFLTNKPLARLPLRDIEDEKINFLLISSNTGGIPRVDDEVEQIKQFLERAGVRSENICILATNQATPESIREKITSMEYQFLHIAAHGGREKNGDAYLQVYEDCEFKRTKKISALNLQEWIEQSDLRFVYLSSCLSAEAYTLPSNQAEPFFPFNSIQSMAQSVVEAKVPEVIGFHWPILDTSSYEFATAFYKSFINNFDSSLALFEARHKMSNFNEKIWAAPVLIQQF